MYSDAVDSAPTSSNVDDAPLKITRLPTGGAGETDALHTVLESDEISVEERESHLGAPAPPPLTILAMRENDDDMGFLSGGDDVFESDSPRSPVADPDVSNKFAEFHVNSKQRLSLADFTRQSVSLIDLKSLNRRVGHNTHSEDDNSVVSEDGVEELSEEQLSNMRCLLLFVIIILVCFVVTWCFCRNEIQKEYWDILDAMERPPEIKRESVADMDDLSQAMSEQNSQAPSDSGCDPSTIQHSTSAASRVFEDEDDVGPCLCAVALVDMHFL